MKKGAGIDDYIVTIGSLTCVVRSLADNLLTCETPLTNPGPTLQEKHLPKRDHYIVVGVGIHLEYLVGIGRYPDESKSLYYIIGGVVGGVVLIAAIIAIIICCVRRKKSTSQEAKSFENRGYDYRIEKVPPIEREKQLEPSAPVIENASHGLYEEINTGAIQHKGMTSDNGGYATFTPGSPGSDEHVYMGVQHTNSDNDYVDIIPNSP